MKKDLYSIGQIAKVLHISETTLRHYDKIKLVTPAYTDEKTGYRYYTFAQFFQIHRIKYFQNIGLSLAEIKETLTDAPGGDKLIRFLKNKKNEHIKAIAELNKTIDSIDWSIDFYSYMNEHIDTTLEVKTFKMRYMLFVPWEDGDSVESSEFRLSALRVQPEFGQVNIRRQWGYVLDYQSLTNKVFKPIYCGMYIDGKPPICSSHVRKIPAGKYLCFNARLMDNDYGNIEYINEYLCNLGFQPKLIYAWEYDTLKNFSEEYTAGIYELQILID